MANDINIPQPPQITEEQLKDCRESGDFRPVLFEWYKYVGTLCSFFASIDPNSSALRQILALHYAVLIGLLTRCSRLMLANVALSHEGLFGETTSIIDRCIFESSTKVVWLCTVPDEDRFTRFIADGLKTELELKNQIEEKIASRQGRKLAIEERMLTSINNSISLSQLSEAQIQAATKLPDLASMIKVIGSDRLHYVVGQKIGSHHVHGTWPSLRLHYLEEVNGVLRPRDHNVPTHVNQLVFTPLLVLEAIIAFIYFIFKDHNDSDDISTLPKAVMDEILKIYSEVVGNDFELVTEI